MVGITCLLVWLGEGCVECACEEIIVGSVACVAVRESERTVCTSVQCMAARELLQSWIGIGSLVWLGRRAYGCTETYAREKMRVHKNDVWALLRSERERTCWLSGLVEDFANQNVEE